MTQLLWNFSIEAVVLEVKVSQKGEVANIRRYGPKQVIFFEVQYYSSLMLDPAHDSLPVVEVARSIP